MKNLFGIFIVAIFLSANAWATPAEVILIRHGEKPENGDELSQRGWDRARKLVNFFLSNPAVTRFGPPYAIYPMAQKKKTSSVRAIQTVTPLADRLHIPLHLDYTRDEYPAAAKEILRNSSYDGKMVLICWEHKVIPDFAKELGLEHGPKDWDDSVFDRAWVLDYAGGHVVRFKDVPQHLLDGDSAR